MTRGYAEPRNAETPQSEGPGTAPHAPVRAWLAERLFRHAVRRLDVRVVLPNGDTLGAGTGDSPVLRLLRPDAFFHRLGVDVKIGFGEAYQAGDWTADDLAGALTPFAARVASIVPAPLQLLRRWVDPAKPATETNTPEQARTNIQHHYDLSNELFAAFLDESMTYSAALYGPDDDLHRAQLRKIDSILDDVAIGPGSRICEIGTGWGTLAIRAAQRGAEVTTLTISAEQCEAARERVRAAGMADRVEVRLQDYRQATGRYDAVVSVEMIEAVGEDYWPEFFSTLHRLLTPGGTASIQAITMPHARMLATRGSYTWIHKYIFPGGQLPSLRAISDGAERVGLHATALRAFGPDYARTLKCWRRRFLDAWQAGTITQLGAGFDENFRRSWEFYLSYSEAGFAGGYLDVWQLSLHKPEP